MSGTTDHPNVLMVVFDTARADATEPYGAPDGSTPTLRQMASAGRSVPHTVAPACWTVPSHISLLTGSLPRTAGMGPAQPDQDGWSHVVSAERERSLPAVLAERGWETAAVSANAWVSAAQGFDTWFDRFHLAGKKRQAGIDNQSLKGRIAWALEALRARADDGAAEIESMLGDWLERRDRQPFMWFVNLVECHSPYLPPAPYAFPGPIARLKAGLDAQRWQSFDAIARTCLGSEPPPPEALERMREMYTRSVRLMDDWLARVLDALDRHGVLDETIVMVTSDHGENFGECGLIGHSFSLDDRLLRVPMILSGPGVADAPVPESGAFGLDGVPALVASLLDLDEHPWGSPDTTGVAVAQLDPPVPDSDPRMNEALENMGLAGDDLALHRASRTLACATDGRNKLFRDADGHEELVIVDDDPLETNPRPVDDDAAQELAPLRSALDRAEELERPAPPLSGESPSGEVEDLEERMRLLGYL